MTTLESSASPATQRVWRIEVHPVNSHDDPLARSIEHEVREQHLAPALAGVRTARVYLVQAALDQGTIERLAVELLADPVNQRWRLGATPIHEGAALVEVHYLPGVMDPVAMSTEDALAEMLGADSGSCQVRTGMRYDLLGVTAEQAAEIAQRLLANPVIQSIHDLPEWPRKFPEGAAHPFRVVQVPMRDLDDADLAKLSREGHLFLSIDEMRAIRDYCRSVGRDPTDIELETLAQTWSEHCVHKTLKSRIQYRDVRFPNSDFRLAGAQATSEISPCAADWANRPGHTLAVDGSLIIDNLLKSTIAAATNQLIADGVDWCISVFVDNAGIIRFDETDAVTFKVETHNHPSAIEPYGGAATGIGGCIRDTMGTGLAARPIANTDVFCVAHPDHWVHADRGTGGPGDQGGIPNAGSRGPSIPGSLPSGVLHPRRILKQVVAGVRDYGNRMGIPTVNGAVYFDDRYLGNPLVFCGSVGLIPNDKCFGKPRRGDRIIALGGRTGRDGIHGATFSSAELTDTHADEFSHAVQIGNAITEKKALDVILAARDDPRGCLYNAITDCGAGGFSSAVGEMGEELGAFVQLENAPLKYEGLTYTEVWISEAQERMVLAVPPENVEQLRQLCESEDVEMSDLGHFGTDNAQLILTWHGEEVGRLSMDFLHNGIPQPVREAEWSGQSRDREGAVSGRPLADTRGSVGQMLLALLSHPNIASKHWIIRQYDHEVQGSSVVKPLAGPRGDGPSDAAVIRPKLGASRGVALSCGLATALGDSDPYWMALAAIDEAVRNAVCVGARPDRIAILDNFCWPSCDRPENLASLVRAAEGCYDGALAYRTPFISGKDSLNNQFTKEDGTVIAIPPTLLISAIGLVEDVTRCVTMDAKSAGNMLIQVGATTQHMGGSHLAMLCGAAGEIPRVDLKTAPQTLAAVARLMDAGHVRSAHDCSEGGMLVAAAEMAFAGRLGLELNLAGAPRQGPVDAAALCFAETPTRILLEVEPQKFDTVARALRQSNIPFGHIGTFNDSPGLIVREDRAHLADVSLDDLLESWRKPLDW
jgi:phosphoribosylformylglycinamidine synthase subunit PurSL